MLERYFSKPGTIDRIRGCWLGPAIEQYVVWLTEHGYQRRSIVHRVPLLVRMAEFTRLRGVAGVEGVADHVEDFVRWRSAHRVRRTRSAAAARQYLVDTRIPIRHFLRVVQATGDAPGPQATAPLTCWAPDFLPSLRETRGLSPFTVEGYAVQLRAFERYLRAKGVDDVQALTPTLLDGFLADRREHVSARSLTMTCAALRAFLRHLHRSGLLARDLSSVIEGPRTYTLSGVVRAISAADVHRTLSGLDRRSLADKRDYAMLLLLAVYGLRAREVAALTLDDVDWHRSVLSVRARKAGHEAVYPLVPEVGEALLDYLQHARPACADRRLFRRMMAPQGPVSPRVVVDRAGHALRQAGVVVARPGSHTFRHSCAQRLVDADFSLKVIGDYLGHRRAASTRIYSKVALEALRDVALGHGEAVV